MPSVVQYWPSAFASPSHLWGAVLGPKSYDKTPHQNTDTQQVDGPEASRVDRCTSGCPEDQKLLALCGRLQR